MEPAIFLLNPKLKREEITLPAGNSNQELTILIATDSDTTDEKDGEISVTLVPADGDQPLYLIELLQSEASVSVIDDDIPVFSISGGDAVTEGYIASFTILADIEREIDLEVDYQINESTDSFVDPSVARTGTISILSENSETILSIPTVNDTIDKEDGIISVTLQAGSNSSERLQIEPNFNEATVQVKDDDTPEISITESEKFSEADEVEFTVSSNIASDSNLLIKYQVQFLLGSRIVTTHTREETIIFPAGETDRNAEIEIELPADLSAAEYDTISITLACRLSN